MKSTSILSAVFLAAVTLGLVAAVQISPAYAAPSLMSCPQLTTNAYGTCTFRAYPNETLWVTASNSAVAVSYYGGIPGNGQTSTAIQADSNGNARVSIRSFEQRGQVTICAYDISRSYRSCSLTRVN